MKTLTISILFVFTAGSVFAASGAGTAAFNFLKIGIGPRALGMGGAYTAVADDATSTHWNPAGLTEMEGAKLAFGYTKYMAGINSGFLAYAKPMGVNSYLGAMINGFYVGGLTRTDENNIELGEFGSSMLVPRVAYARRLSENLSAGVAVKLIYQSIDTFNSYGMALDVGGSYAPTEVPYSFAVVVQNLGQQLKAFVEEKDLPPITAKVGGVYRHREAPFLVGLDAGKSIDSDIFFSLGAEYWVNEMLGLRFGYYSLGRDLHSGSDTDILGGLSFGLGLKWKKYDLDYALVPKVDFGYVHRLSISLDM